ncbi:MAG: TldD/PmbA family protein [Prevotellaceae bacterium]|jgi:PmbA protein|nr:TldD/PmbA family protein [Prevotellaceae bacterium]
MISNEHKKIAQQAMEFALKNGAQACRVNISASTNTSFEMRDTQLDRLEQASENGMSIELYVDGRYGSVSSNKLNKEDIERLIKNGIDATRFLAEDPFRKLPDPLRYYKGESPDLQLIDNKQNSILPDEKLTLAKSVINDVYGTDNRIISTESSYSDGDYFTYKITSNGFEGESGSTWYSLGGSVALKGEGDARPAGYWYESAIYFDLLNKTNIGKTALERGLKKLGQKKIKSGKYPMILDNLSSGRLLSPMINALSGGALQQKSSFLLDKLGEKIGSDKFTLIDNPHIVKASGARYFDYEGIATQKRTVYEKGILKTYFIDTYNALKMNTQPTISGASLLEMELGQKDFNRMLKDIKSGIYVTGFNGGNSNGTTGDFSFGIEGFLIENGELTQPINEMNITGNMVSLWANLAEVGNDPRLTSSWRIPSLLFNNVDFSGL